MEHLLYPLQWGEVPLVSTPKTCCVLGYSSTRAQILPAPSQGHVPVPLGEITCHTDSPREAARLFRRALKRKLTILRQSALKLPTETQPDCCWLLVRTEPTFLAVTREWFMTCGLVILESGFKSPSGETSEGFHFEKNTFSVRDLPDATYPEQKEHHSALLCQKLFGWSILPDGKTGWC